jgi:lipopolysaccharide transport protein LptA
LCYNATGLQAARDHLVLINIDAVGNTANGPAHLTADRAEATGADFGNSHWVFTGHVHIDMKEGRLQAATATVQLLDRHIASIMAGGMPAQFERTPQSAAAAAGTAAGLTVHGHADTITYNVGKNEVQLNGDSWLTDGCNDFTSQRITYNLAAQSVLANAEPGSNALVHGIIRNTHPGGTCTAAAVSGAQPRTGATQPPASAAPAAPAERP